MNSMNWKDSAKGFNGLCSALAVAVLLAGSVVDPIGWLAGLVGLLG